MNVSLGPTGQSQTPESTFNLNTYLVTSAHKLCHKIIYHLKKKKKNVNLCLKKHTSWTQ